LAAAAAAAADATNKDDNNLLGPAIRGMTFGFVGGVIVILALMALAPSLVQAGEMGGARAVTHGARR
jgi:hypothetical protein